MKTYAVRLENIVWLGADGYIDEFPDDFDAIVNANNVSEAIEKAKEFAQTEHDWKIEFCDVRASTEPLQ